MSGGPEVRWFAVKFFLIFPSWFLFLGIGNQSSNWGSRMGMGAGGKSRHNTGAIRGLLFLGAALSLTGCKLGGVDLPYTVTVEQPYITASKTLAAPGDLITVTTLFGFTPAGSQTGAYPILFSGACGTTTGPIMLYPLTVLPALLSCPPRT
jgi:hypothetical protein